MYCKYCGNKISNDAVFCEKCGRKLKEDAFNNTFTPPRPQIPVYNTVQDDKGRYLANIKFNPAFCIIGIVMNAFIAVAGSAIAVWASNLRFYEKLYQQKDMLIAIGIIAIVGSLIGVVCYIITIIANSDIQCTAYENKVVGRAVNSRGSTTKVNFEFFYDEIDGVSANRKIITIIVKGMSYIIAASSVAEATNMAGIISSKIQNSRN